MDTCFIYCRKSSEDKNRQILSLDDQEKIGREVAADKGFTIRDVYRESKSAKRPNKRPGFQDMMGRINQREATHIVCWKADRLCRNAQEGGMLIDKVDYEGLRIVAPAVEYDRSNSTFLFMEFGMATKYSKDLSDNVHRGLNTKLQMGWLPGVAPLGYLNSMTKSKGNNDIIPDPLRFDLCRKWWDLMLTGKETIASSRTKITALGLRSKRTGRAVSKTEAARFFRNIFYTGLFNYRGERFTGKHLPLITMAEYIQVQQILDGRIKTQIHQNDYYFMKLFTCGECSAAITAEQHTKRYKNGTSQTFIYGRCTKKLGLCSQPYVNASDLKEQLLAFIASLEIRPSFVIWLRAVLKRRHQSELAAESIQKGLRTKRIDTILLEKKKLFGMKDDGLINEEDYLKEKNKLLEEEQRLKEQNKEVTTMSFEDALEEVLAFAANLIKIFRRDDPETKRMVLRILGSNLKIKGKKVCIDAKNAFIFLKLVEKKVYEGKQWLEPEKSLKIQSNQAFLQGEFVMAGSTGLRSNLFQYITPELTSQLKVLKEHLEKSNSSITE